MDAKDNDRSRRWATLGFGALAAVFMGIVFVNALRVINKRAPDWPHQVVDHFAAIVGLPTAAIASFALVVFLRQTEGPMEFEALGFKLKGAAGQVVLWVACFLAMAAAIKLLWKA